MADKHPSEMTLAELWTLPSVNSFPGAVALSFEYGGGLWDVGWNGSWLKCWSPRNPPYVDTRGPSKWDCEV